MLICVFTTSVFVLALSLTLVLPILNVNKYLFIIIIMAAQFRALASSVYGIIRVMYLWCIYYVGRVDKCVQNFGVSPLKNGSFRRSRINWRIILRWI